jgi:hypothetical protein
MRRIGQHRNGLLQRLQVIDSKEDRGWTTMHRHNDPLVLNADPRHQLRQMRLGFGKGPAFRHSHKYDQNWLRVIWSKPPTTSSPTNSRALTPYGSTGARQAASPTANTWHAWGIKGGRPQWDWDQPLTPLRGEIFEELSLRLNEGKAVLSRFTASTGNVEVRVADDVTQVLAPGTLVTVVATQETVPQNTAATSFPGPLWIRRSSW